MVTDAITANTVVARVTTEFSRVAKRRDIVAKLCRILNIWDHDMRLDFTGRRIPQRPPPPLPALHKARSPPVLLLRLKIVLSRMAEKQKAALAKASHVATPNHWRYNITNNEWNKAQAAAADAYESLKALSSQPGRHAK